MEQEEWEPIIECSIKNKATARLHKISLQTDSKIKLYIYLNSLQIEINNSKGWEL